VIKNRRISVPLTLEIRTELAHRAAKNGCSLAAELAKAVAAGIEKSNVAEQLAALKNDLQTNRPEKQNDHQTENKIGELLAVLNAKIDRLAGENQSPKEGVFISAAAFLHLFEASYFCSFLVQSLVSELPGVARMPLPNHLQNARTKAKAAVQQFIDLETKK